MPIFINSGRFGSVFSPSSLPNVVWFDPSDAASVTEVSGAVSQINDKGAGGIHLAQATSGNRPAYTSAAVNGLNAMTFDGTDDFISSSANLTLAQPLQYFVVVKATVVTTGQIVAYSTGTGSPSLFLNGAGVMNCFAGSSINSSTTLLTTATSVITLTVKGASSGFRLNGVATAGGGTSGSVAYAGVPFGLGKNLSGGVAYFNGIICEVIACTEVSTTIRDQCEAYLIAKWGI